MTVKVIILTSSKNIRILAISGEKGTILHMKRKRATKKPASKLRGSRGYLATRVMVGVLGLILSVILHELFHILVHWGDIQHVHFLSSGGAIVEVNVWAPPGYDLEGEEIAAYGITLLVILITTMIIFKIGDSEDRRSSSQILFPKDKDMQKLSPSRMLELTDPYGPPESGRTAKRVSKPRRRRSTAR